MNKFTLAALVASAFILNACAGGFLAALPAAESVVAAEVGYAETTGGHDGYAVQGLQWIGRQLCGDDAEFDANGNCGDGKWEF